MDYLKFFKKAGSLTWNKRYLWRFGFLMALLPSLNFNYFFGQEEKISFLQEGFWRDFISNQPFLAGGAIVFIFGLFIFLGVLSVLGRGALIGSLGRELEGRGVDFRWGIKKGKENFWKIFLIGLYLGIFTFLLFVFLSIPVVFLFFNRNFFLGGVMAFLAFLIFIPLVVLASYLGKFGCFYAVLGGLRTWSAIENAYALFRRNISSSLWMGVFSILFGFLMIFLILISLLPLAILLAILGGISFLILGKASFLVLIILGGIFFLLLTVFLRSVYAVFSQAVWVLFFWEIAKKKETVLAAEEKKEVPIPMEKIWPAIEAEK